MNPIYFQNAELEYLEVYDVAAIHKVFQSIVSDFQIEFNFPQGSCQQRAQIMSMLLAKKFNIDHLKVWLFPPVALYVGDARTLYIEDKNGLPPGNRIEWNYHVVPVVQVVSEGIVNTMVIDPSVNKSRPLLLEEWFRSIGNSNVSKYTFLLPDKYFFYCLYNSSNMLTTLFDGSFFNYDNPVKDDLVMERGLALNDMAIQMFHKYIAPLRASANGNNVRMLEDLTEIFGNITALDMLFSQNISGYSMNTRYRYVITHYSTIFNEARAIYNERVVYWTKLTNELL